MKLILSTLIILVPFTIISAESTDKNARISKSSGISLIQDIENPQWEELSRSIAEMMINADNNGRDTIDVFVYVIVHKNLLDIYEGLFQYLTAQSSNKITISILLNSNTKFHKMHVDYLIILIHDVMKGTEEFLFTHFKMMFPKKEVRIFLIESDASTNNFLLNSWKCLVQNKYYNLYIIRHYASGSYEIFRTSIGKRNNNLNIYLSLVPENKFLTIQDTLKGDEMPFIGIIYYDNYPLSYTRNNKIIGAEGSLMEEFSRKLHTPYQIINNSTLSPKVSEVADLIETQADINLYPYINIRSDIIKTIWLNDDHGMCLLAPRNIQVSAYENFALPLDTASLIMSLISTICFIICWRLVTKDMSMSEILFAVYELILNLGASGIENLTFRENILVYCFIFSSFIMVSHYESIFISFMLAESTMRSAYSIQELNESSTKFYSFYDEKIARQNNVPMIRQELIMKYVDFYGHVKLNVPEKFDENLVYFVFCDYADYFIRSSRNYRDGFRLFDKITIGLSHKTYNVRSGYFYIEEFKQFVEKVMEAGIYKFWKYKDQQITNEVISQKYHDESQLDTYNMSIPMMILTFGCSIALIVLLVENIVHRWKLCCVNRMRRMGNRVSCSFSRKKKVELDKWRKKFIYKKCLDSMIKPKNSKTTIPSKNTEPLLTGKDETIRCRESVRGDFFLMKKFGNERKSKKIKPKKIKPQIIQVRPYEAESSL